METREKFRSFYYETAGDLPEVKLDPKKTALLIVDMQNEFVLRDFGEALEFKEAGEWDRWIPFHDRLDDIVIPNNVKLLNFFRENGLTVTFGRIACLREDGEDRSPVQKSEGWNNMLMPVNSFSAAMIDELAPLENEIVVNKTTVVAEVLVRKIRLIDLHIAGSCFRSHTEYAFQPCKSADPRKDERKGKEEGNEL